MEIFTNKSNLDKLTMLDIITYNKEEGMRYLCLLSICGLLFAAPVQPTVTDVENTDCICHSDDGIMMAPFAITWSLKAAATSCAVSRVAGVWGSDGKFHMVCGNCQTHTSHPTDEIWDPASNTWATGLTRPTAGVHNHHAVAVGTKIYVGGGTSGAAVDDNFTMIDLVGNTWTSIGTMPVTGLYYYKFATAGGKIFMFGGSSSGGTVITNVAYSYDTTTGVWTALANMPAAMRDVAVGAVGDTVYIAGGTTTYPNGLNTLWKYSISGNTYTAGPNMPGAMFWAVGVIAPHQDSAEQFLVMGGQNGTSYLNTVYRYNVRGNYWVTETPFSTGRRSHAGAASSDGYLYVSCGWNGAFLNTLEEGIPNWLPTGVEEKPVSTPITHKGSVVVAPNPFKGRTTVSYQIPVSVNVNLALYDVAGKRIMNLVSGEQPAGSHHVDLDLKSLTAGVYIIRLNYGTQTEVTKLIIAE